MSRNVRALPADRADYGFGDLIYWHLFVYGTRPNGDPAAPAGREWNAATFRQKLNITDRTLRNWMAERSLPDSTNEIAEVLFGDNPLFDAWRFEISEALRAARLEKSRKSRSGFHSETSEPPSAAGESEGASEPEASRAADDRGAPESSPASVEQDAQARRSSSAIVPYTRGGDDDGQTGGNVTVIRPVWKSQRSGGHHAPPRRTIATALVSGLVILVGLYGWTRPAPERPSNAPPPTKAKPDSEPPPPAPTRETTREEVKGKPAAPVTPTTEATQQQATKAKPEPTKNDPASTTETNAEAPKALPQASQPKSEPPPAQVDPHKAADEARAAEKHQIEQEAAAARQQAFDAAQHAEEEVARQLDADPDPDAAAAQAAQDVRQKEARAIIGIGYRLIENNSAIGVSLGHVLTATVAECAQACQRANCDAFTFPNQPRAGANNYCFRYKAPLEFRADSSSRSGKRIADAPAPQKLADAGSASTGAPLSLAQAGPPSLPPAKADDLTRCANGVFKVSGFRLSCDRILGGGTTLGSAQLRYTVANINQCAAKCQPIARCVGFTYNAADPDGQHSCEIFGPTPEMREVGGYVSGVR